MDNKRRVRVSKYLSKHLRHSPERLGLTLTAGGWVAIDELLAAMERDNFRITRDELDEVVATSDKQRFAIDADRGLIRANQGHSADVDLELERRDPPELLYHGTVDRFLDSIWREGLKKMNRHHVHLSATIDVAIDVGRRRGAPIVLSVAAALMSEAGFELYCSTNGVWLVDRVPPEYLQAITLSD